MKKNCLICQNKFSTCLSDIKRGRDKYCSRKCYYKSRIGIKRSEETIAKMREAQKGKKSHSWRGGEISLYCLICKKEFKVKICKKDTAKFCSKKCHGKWDSENLIGEKARTWKGGLTPINKLIRSLEKSRKWAREIKERDNFICQICYVRGGILRSNHIKKFSDYPELRLSLNNGITICKNCDIKLVLHREEQWENYFNLNLKNRGYLKIEETI